MPGGGWAKKLPPKTQNQSIIDFFRLAGLDHLIQGKWLTSQMWDGYIHKNHPFSDASLVDSDMSHHDLSYDPNLRHIEIYGRVDYEGVYHHYLTGKICLISTSVRFKKRVRLGMTTELRQAGFCLSASTTLLPRILAYKRSFKSVMTKVIPKMIGQQTPT